LLASGGSELKSRQLGNKSWRNFAIRLKDCGAFHDLFVGLTSWFDFTKAIKKYT